MGNRMRLGLRLAGSCLLLANLAATCGTENTESEPNAGGSAGSAGAGTGGSVADAGGSAGSQDAGLDATVADAGGVYTLTGVTETPPGESTWGDAYGGAEIIYAAGTVEYNLWAAPSSTLKMRFTWNAPPGQIHPGELWPITGTAAVLENVSPKFWQGALYAKVSGGLLFPSDGFVRVDNNTPAGDSVSVAATAVCPPGGTDFDVWMSAPGGNYAAEYLYHYKWNP